MAHMMQQLKKAIPKPLLQTYHYCLGKLAVIFYGDPSSKMIVIGVTGTNGKTTTCNLIADLLAGEKAKVGLATTVNYRIAEKEWLNKTKMTMLGRFQLQKMLARMVKAGCRYAVIETSSQGVEQFRHIGINYDYLVFTNLTPEHIEAHGGFENYKKAKGKLFERLSKLPRKKIDGKEISKISIINLDDEHAHHFLSFGADRKIGYTLNDVHTAEVETIYSVKDVALKPEGSNFNFEGANFSSSMIGRHNVYNLAAALSVAFEEKIDLIELEKRTRTLKGVPGRLEFIDEGQDYKVIVDYAYDPKAMEALYETIKLIPHQKIIHIFGGSGGGRDQSRQAVLGEMAGNFADIIIVTMDEPYDDDPKEIAGRVMVGARKSGNGKDIQYIEDRQEAIAKGIGMAQTGDLVLITGLGATQYIPVRKQKIPHDDRVIARLAIKLAAQNKNK